MPSATLAIGSVFIGFATAWFVVVAADIIRGRTRTWSPFYYIFVAIVGGCIGGLGVAMVSLQ